MKFWKTNLDTLSDKELIQRYKTKLDKDCVGVLAKRYAHLMYGVCLSYLKNEDDAQDAVMDVFEQLFEKLLLHDISNFKSWLYSVSKNHCLMTLRKSKGESLKKDGYMRIVKDNMDNNEFLHPIDEEDKEKNYELLAQAISELKPEQKECVELFYLEEKSYREISELTGYELKKVKSHIQNGKRNLRNLMDQYNDGKTA